MTIRKEQTKPSSGVKLEQERKVRLASPTKVSAPVCTPGAQRRWWEKSCSHSPLFLPTPCAHPHYTEARQHHLCTVGRRQLALSLHPSGLLQAGNIAQRPASCPGTQQGGHSLTGVRGQVWGRLDAVALPRGSSSPPPAALPYRSPISSCGPAFYMGYASCGTVT